MRILRHLILGLLLLACILPGAARAQYCNNQLIGGLFYGAVAVSVTSLSFGAYSSAASTDSQSNVSVTASCFGGLVGGTLPPFTVAMSAGGGTFAQRRMQSGTATLRYQIYTSAVLSTVWGDGTGSTSTVGGGNTGTTSQTIMGYGVIPSGQYVTPGSYTDNITVTVSY
jgi:spore coat protein U-like protein